MTLSKARSASNAAFAEDSSLLLAVLKSHCFCVHDADLRRSARHESQPG